MSTTASEADKGLSVVVVGWTLTAISALVVSLRLYTRITRVRKVGADDYLMLCSLACEISAPQYGSRLTLTYQLCGLTHAVFLTVAWQQGLGSHFDSLTPDQQQTVLKLIIAGVELFSIVTSLFGRISFCVFLLHVISPADVVKNKTLRAIIGIQVVANLVCLIQIYSQCGSKVEALWDFRVAASAQCQSPMVQTLVGYGELPMHLLRVDMVTGDDLS